MTKVPESLGVPAARPVLDTPGSGTILGFPAAGAQAVAWWRRLRDAHPETGLWPLLIDEDTPARVAACPSEIPADDLPGGAEILAQRGEARMCSYSDALAEEIRAERRGEGLWPTEPVRPGFRLAAGPSEVTVALVPAEAGWRVPEVLGYGGWNDYPDPAEHAAILRHWHGRYGAEPVAMTGDSVELSLARPPRTRLDALALAWEYRAYNDGEYDFYFADTLTELAAALLDAEVLLARWE
ncbi:DUF4253 domain-containing protein [Amycolatopsis sp. H20-H5]|uniref:DUF4253 domain-containing protein n=1 Tax=Amycolatopsis sp. H20-H5 TaxID=3046309 RepID=UPI002DBFF49F|nr:DUF4253 domain-containing protein [Amycolatopsis sp. H20-H5]MEC3981239.1 DUF4253 domain-containing protein [Amycolatopsis sp. H20-H5]